MKCLPILILFIATSAHATVIEHTFFAPNIHPYFTEGMCEIIPPCGDGLFLHDPHAYHLSIAIEVWGPGGAGWVTIVRAYPRPSSLVRLDLPDHWDCHLVRMRFLSAGWGYSDYSNIFATPPGCVPTEYVPEPGGMALLAGIGVLGLLKRHRGE